MDTSRPVRLLVVGMFDLFHYGHVNALKAAKELFPKTFVIVGVWPGRSETPTIMKHQERVEVVKACRYVDLVLSDTPFALDKEYFEKYNIDHIVGDEEALGKKIDPFVAATFKPLPRTEGIDQSLIVHRVLARYESHKRDFQVKSSTQMTKSSLRLPNFSSWVGGSRQMSLLASWQQWGTDMLNQGYLRGFTQRVLHGWNILGRVRELRYYSSQKKTREIAAPEEEESTDEERAGFKAECLAACKSVVKGWQSVSLGDIELTPVSGGLTNRLTKVSIKPELAKSLGHGIVPQVLVRHYGIGTETFFDRENEHKIFEEFSKRGLGPYLHGFFEGGRIEEFMNARNLRNEELPDLLATIGEKMANMHHCKMDIPTKPMLFENLFNWLSTARDVTLPDDQVEKQKLLSQFDFNAIEKELYELKDRLLALNSPLCFCHNDLLCGNMMLHEESKELFFIDYEYGSYNYRGYDFGNHFCEWTLDYSTDEHPKFKLFPEKYPTEEQQKKLFAAYLYQTKKITEQEELLPTPEEIGTLMKEANHFALAAHLLWSLWGIIQSASSAIQFGYLEFSRDRLEEYFRLKKLVIEKYQ